MSAVPMIKYARQWRRRVFYLRLAPVLGPWFSCRFGAESYVQARARGKVPSRGVRSRIRRLDTGKCDGFVPGTHEALRCILTPDATALSALLLPSFAVAGRGIFSKEQYAACNDARLFSKPVASLGCGQLSSWPHCLRA